MQNRTPIKPALTLLVSCLAIHAFDVEDATNIAVDNLTDTHDGHCLLQIGMRLSVAHRQPVSKRGGFSPSQVALSLPGNKENKMVHDKRFDRAAEPDVDQLKIHRQRVAEMRGGPPPSLIFYGSSSMELWREEMFGEPVALDGGSIGCISNASGSVTGFRPCERDVMDRFFIFDAGGNRPLFRKVFEERYGRSVVMAVGGDHTQDLLWRLENGEALAQRARAIVVDIGVNNLMFDLGAFHYLNPATLSGWKRHLRRAEASFGDADADKIYFGIKAVVQKILETWQAPVVLNELRPTGVAWPSGPYGAVIPRVNSLLRQLAASSTGTLHMIDCSWVVLDSKTGKIDPDMTLDFLHPSHRGMARWADCMSSALDKLQV